MTFLPVRYIMLQDSSQCYDRVVKRMAVYNGLFRAIRMLSRPFTFLHERPDLKRVPNPCVFICRHRNLRGPVFTLLHLNRQMRPWVFSVFCDKQSCCEQYSGYTFRVRVNWPAWYTKMVSYLLSRIVPYFMRCIGAIPVFRSPMKARVTFRQSLDALLLGESLIIYPDVDYVSTSDQPGELYTGFLVLGQMYKRATGKDLCFVPLDIKMNRRSLLVGEAIVFDGNAPFSEERARVAGALKKELERLGRDSGFDKQVYPGI